MEKKKIAGKTEEEVYKKLGLAYINPEMRESSGEIEAAREGKLPELIGYDDVLGDCHMHTTWSDGALSTEEMIKACIARGYAYCAITDHSKSQHVANGLDEKRLVKHCDEINLLQKKYPGIKILKGAEIDILADGSLDYKPKTLELLDFRIGALHSGFKQPKEQATKRLVAAIESGYLHIIGHPTGRLINGRNPIEFDLDLVFAAAKKNNVAFEINANPARLDLKDVHIRAALQKGCKLMINTDAHSEENLNFMNLGIAQARRGWTTKEDVVNTWEWKKVEKWLVR